MLLIKNFKFLPSITTFVNYFWRYIFVNRNFVAWIWSCSYSETLWSTLEELISLSQTRDKQKFWTYNIKTCDSSVTFLSGNCITRKYLKQYWYDVLIDRWHVWVQLFDLISAGPLIAPDWEKTGLFMEKIHSLLAESRDDVVCNFTSILA